MLLKSRAFRTFLHNEGRFCKANEGKVHAVMVKDVNKRVRMKLNILAFDHHQLQKSNGLCSWAAGARSEVIQSSSWQEEQLISSIFCWFHFAHSGIT